MTNNNYTTYSNDELVICISNISVAPKTLRCILRDKFPPLYYEILNRTKFLDVCQKNKPISIHERIYCIENNITEYPTCTHPDCNNPVEWRKSERKFALYCCMQHCNSDPEHKQKIKETNIKNLGVEYPMQSQIVREKSRQSCLNNLGVEYPSQSEKVKSKSQNTSILHFGTTHPMKCEEVKNRLKQKMLGKHGVEYSFQLRSVREKSKKTLNERLGVDYPAQSPMIKEKIKIKCQSKYGGNAPACSAEVRGKMERTNHERRGVAHPLQCKDVLQKVKSRMMERHGVEWYPQSQEYHKKAHKRYTNLKYPDMTFGSSWEFKVYDFLVKHNISFEYQPSISLPYEYKGTHHTYHPDFLVGDKIIEVKGDNFFRINESTGKEEMFCPYKDDDWTNEKYDWMCGLYEAKHQCMIANNVIVIRHSNFKAGLEHIFCT